MQGLTRLLAPAMPAPKASAPKPVPVVGGPYIWLCKETTWLLSSCSCYNHTHIQHTTILTSKHNHAAACLIPNHLVVCSYGHCNSIKACPGSPGASGHPSVQMQLANYSGHCSAPLSSPPLSSEACCTPRLSLHLAAPPTPIRLQSGLETGRFLMVKCSNPSHVSIRLIEIMILRIGI